MTRVLQIVILVPTRNRNDLAARAVRSALGQTADALVKVVASDNSDNPAEAQALREEVARISDRRLDYLRPPAAMDMGSHWDWAVAHCIKMYSPTHLMVLTDRMVFRGQAVAELARIAEGRPADVITYMHDRVNDLVNPVVLERGAFSGTACQVQSRRLLELSAHCKFHQSLPRLLNTVAPVAVLEKVRAAFGDYCHAVSPDFGFAYRCLATHAGIVFYDKALTIHSGLARSNGASAASGVLSKDAMQFRALHKLGHAPYPEIFSLGNSIIEEYCRVRGTPAGAGLPAVEMRRYVKMLYANTMALADESTRERFRSQLRQRAAALLRWFDLRYAFKQNFQWIEKGVKRVTRRRAKAPGLSFATVEEALAFDLRHPPGHVAGLDHLSAIAPVPL